MTEIDSLNIICEALKDHLSDEICDSQNLARLKRLPFSSYEKCLNMLNNQTLISLNTSRYTIYSVELDGHNVRHIVDIDNDLDEYGKPSDEYTIVLQTDKHAISLHILSIEDMMIYIAANNKSKRYIFLPISMSSFDENQNGHFSALVFDNMKFKVYFLDPNGRSKYFNSLCDTNHCIYKLFEKYIKDLNEFWSTKYEFVDCYEWNPYNFALNYEFKQSTIGTGHCVMSTFIILHILVTTEFNIEDVYKLFGNLSETEMLYIINGYSKNFGNRVLKTVSPIVLKQIDKSIEKSIEKSQIVQQQLFDATQFAKQFAENFNLEGIKI